jgi:glycosyltransferase involved in cell wall biosynthesis
LFLGALKVLRERGVLFEANVYGDALPKDEDYMDSLNYKNLANFHHGVPNYKTPEIYNSHEIFVNLTPSGSFDKTILESAVCGCLSVIANTSLKGEINNKLIVGDLNPEKIADAIEYWLKANEEEKEKIRENLQNYVLENHSLNALMDGLYNVVVSNAK